MGLYTFHKKSGLFEGTPGPYLQKFKKAKQNKICVNSHTPYEIGLVCQIQYFNLI